MPAGLRKHVRYPEMLLKLQAEVYGLYHMTNPEVFYNRVTPPCTAKRPSPYGCSSTAG